MQLMEITNLAKFLESVLPMKSTENLLISGAPGIGKSEITYQVCEKLGLKLLEVRLYEEGETAAGLPKLHSDITEFTKTWWFKELETGKYDVLFLDDFHLVPPMIQSYLYRFLTSRVFHNYTLEKPIKIIVAGNFNLQTASATEVQSPIMSRFSMAVEYKPTVDTFIEYMTQKPDVFHVSIIAFLKAFPDYLYHTDPPYTEMYHNPRSWERLSRYIMENEQMHKFAPAIVGYDAGGKFVEYWKILARPLHDLLKVDIQTIKENSPRDVYAHLAAIALHFADAVSNGDKESVKAIVNYISQQVDPDSEEGNFYNLFVYQIFKSRKLFGKLHVVAMRSTPDVREYLKKYTEEMVSISNL